MSSLLNIIFYSLGKVITSRPQERIPPGVAAIDFQYPSFRHSTIEMRQQVEVLQQAFQII